MFSLPPIIQMLGKFRFLVHTTVFQVLKGTKNLSPYKILTTGTSLNQQENDGTES